MCAKRSQKRPQAAPLATPATQSNYEIRNSGAADRDLKKLVSNQEVLRSIVATIRSLGENPRRNGVERIKGSDDTYRIRDGEYRIIFQIDDNAKLVLVTRVRDRKDVYKN